MILIAERMFLEKSIFIVFLVFIARAEDQQKELVDSSNEFCFSLLKTMPKDENVFFSPASIYLALGMLYAGAEGATAEEMQSALNYDQFESGEENIHQLFANLIKTLKNTSSEYSLEVANAFLYQRDYPVLPHFKETLKSYYDALLEEMEFGGDQTRTIEEINEWVKAKTNGKISELIEELSPSTVMLLLNAIYFKAIWNEEFDPKLTRDDTFYNNEDTPVNIPLMVKNQKLPYGLFPNEGFELAELPYKGKRITMQIILPFSYHKLDEVERNIKLERLGSLVSSIRTYTSNVEVHLPKFKLENSKKLKGYLSFLGLNNLFTASADFSGINGAKNLYVSEVLHKAVIEVNEKGSEAAAVTAVEMVEISGPPSLYVNRPFLFFIRDRRTDLILFAGRVTNL